MFSTGFIIPMSTTHPLPATQSVTLRSTAAWRVLQSWASFFATGFVLGMLLMLLIRLQVNGDGGTLNDQIVQRLAIFFACTLLLACLAWNWISFLSMKGGYRIAAGIGAAVCLFIAIVVSIETMRRPMDFVVTGGAAPTGDQVLQPFPTQR